MKKIINKIGINYWCVYLLGVLFLFTLLGSLKVYNVNKNVLPKGSELVEFNKMYLNNTEGKN